MIQQEVIDPTRLQDFLVLPGVADSKKARERFGSRAKLVDRCDYVISIH